MPGVTDTPSFNVHLGDDVTTVFPHTLFAYLSSQIKVYTVEGTDDPVDVTGSVTVTLNSSFIGGNVTFGVAPTSAQKVLIQREVPYSQETEFADLTRYKETSMEIALNTLCLEIQQLRDGLSGAVKYLPTAGVSNARITAAVDGAVPIFSGTTGILIPGPTADEIENAQGYALDAAAALAACQTIYDNFDDRYLGQKSSAPTVDNDGNALIDGALYYNTVDNKMYVYDLGTTTWLAIETNIGDGTVTEPKISTGAVTTTKIGDLAVTATKIADATITYVKMASASLASAAEIISGTASKLVTAAGLKAAAPNMVLQVVQSETTASTGITATIPIDNTIPQNTEGTELLTVTITPKASNSKIRLRAVVQGGNSTSAYNAGAVFKDSDANAIGVGFNGNGGGVGTPLVIDFMVNATDTTARTYKLRVGTQAGTWTINGNAGVGALFNGTCKTTFTAEEIAQ